MFVLAVFIIPYLKCMKGLDVIFKCNSYFSLYTSGILGFILDRILVTKYSSLINQKYF